MIIKFARYGLTILSIFFKNDLKKIKKKHKKVSNNLKEEMAKFNFAILSRLKTHVRLPRGESISFLTRIITSAITIRLSE